MAETKTDLIGALATSVDEDRTFLEVALRDCPAGEAAQIEKLATMGLITAERGYRIWAEQLGMPFHPLDERSLDPRHLHRLPLDISLRHHAIAVDETDGVLSVALKNPFDLLAVDEIQEVTGLPVQVVLATPQAIAATLERMQRGSSGIEGLIQRLLKAEIDIQSVSDADKLRRMVGDDAVVKLVDHLIAEAMRGHASDIHVEPQRDGLRVRIRIDGDLDTLYTLPAGLHRAVVARIKVVSGMDIGESRKPQDGRIAVSEKVELRVSVLPSVLGEKAVLRVLDRRSAVHDPARIGMSDHNLGLFRRGYTSPNGIVLLTGPTGSGKTTTLYAAMGELNRADTNLVTVEDPVEYELTGATQVQVDVKADRTFANALRSILRQDPDVVMIGEIRDAETAAIAVQAALTGHMVLSTLHTNSALAAVHRLVDMGVAPYLLGPSLRAVVGQRLVPKVCPDCSEPADPAPAVLAEFGLDARRPPAGLRQGRGCQSCRNRGRTGRIAIHEVLYVTPELGSAISRRAPDTEIERLAAAAGYQRLLQDGLAKAQQGLVTLEDVLAVARTE
ncbi:MAG: type II/IV secretion system protein [Planctomycetes bacterium]|nr:type II/IV secretion system protein [Planctomycetota bacterium]